MSQDENAAVSCGCMFLFVVLHVLVICPAIIIPTLVFGILHILENEGMYVLDVVAPLLTIFLGIIPIAIFIIACICRKGDQSENGFAKTVRYVLSKLRFPGFWGASVREANASSYSKREKSKDRWAICVFFTWFVALVLLFIGMMGGVIDKDEYQYKREEVHLLNGMTYFKPDFPSSLNKTYLVVNSDGSLEGAVSNNTDLIQGPVLEKHVRDYHPDDEDGLSFAYTFTPGSVVSLNISSSSEMRIFYKRNETVVKRNEMITSFELSFTETSFTSYLVRITCPNSDTRLSYDFVAKTMIFNMSGGLIIGEDTRFEINRGQVMLFARNSSRCARDEYITVSTQRTTYGDHWNYSRSWICISLDIIGVVLILQEVFTVCLVGKHSGPFTETHSSERNKCRVLGHINIFLLMLAGMSIFAVGSVLYKDEIDRSIDGNTLIYMYTPIHTGQQIIVPLNDTKDPQLTFDPLSSLAQLSAIRELPDTPSIQSINCTPNPFMFNNSWSGDFYIVEKNSLEWDLETTIPFNLTVRDSNDTVVYHEENETASKHELTVISTGVYSLSINTTTYQDALLTFHAMTLKAPMLDLSKCLVWSSQESFQSKQLEPEVKYFVVDPANPNITASSFSLRLAGYDDSITPVVTAFGFLVTFGIVFCVLLVLAIVFMVLDLIGVRPSCCFVCSRMSGIDEEQTGKTQSEQTNLVHKDQNDVDDKA